MFTIAIVLIKDLLNQYLNNNKIHYKYKIQLLYHQRKCTIP